MKNNVIQFPKPRVRRFLYTETTVFPSGLTIIYNCYQEGATVPRSVFEETVETDGTGGDKPTPSNS